MISTAKSGVVRHPSSGKEYEPAPLLGPKPTLGPDSDPRTALAAWMTAADNPFFPRVIVNRIWADLMGRGLVEPVDDLRATNPPSNGPLLDALATEFRTSMHYNLKQLIRTIM